MAERIATLITAQNDQFRNTWGADFTVPRRIVMTRSVADLGYAEHTQIMQAVQQYSDFPEDNNPYGEHGFGVFTVLSQGKPLKLYWKIDLYGRDCEHGSETRHDLTVIRHLADLLTAEGEKPGALSDKTTGTSIRSVWTPTAENFFKRVSGAHLESIYQNLLDLAPYAFSKNTSTRFEKHSPFSNSDKERMLISSRTLDSDLFTIAPILKSHYLNEFQIATQPRYLVNN